MSRRNQLVWREAAFGVSRGMYVYTPHHEPDILPYGGDLLAYATRIDVHTDTWRVVHFVAKGKPADEIQGVEHARSRLYALTGARPPATVGEVLGA